MKPKAYIFAGLAIVCGLGASYMTSRLLADRTQEEPERVNILVAKRSINVGERVSKPEEMFEVKAVTKENEPPDAIKDFDALKGKVLRQSRNKGDHVVPGNLYDKDGIELPEGFRAVGVNVNLGTTAHGLATLPGSRVDLYLTARGGTRVLLTNVLVIAADGRREREGEQMAPASVVTFALNPKDSLKVTLAKTLGELSLVLRKLNDTSNEEGEIVVTEDILGGKKKKDEDPKEPVKPPVVVAQQPTPPEPKEEVKPAPRDIQSTTFHNGPSIFTHQVERLPNGETRPVDGSIIDAPPPPPPPATPRPQQQPRQPQTPRPVEG